MSNIRVLIVFLHRRRAGKTGTIHQTECVDARLRKDMEAHFYSLALSETLRKTL